MKFPTKNSSEEKLAILDKLAGSGLKHGSEYIEDAIRLANREGEEDREDLDLIDDHPLILLDSIAIDKRLDDKQGSYSSE